MAKRKYAKSKPPPLVEIAAVILILAIAALAVVGNRTFQPAEVSVPITAETISSACISGERGEIGITAAGSSIVITVPIETPTPCYEVRAEATMKEGTIAVSVSTDPKGGFCAQCLGIVVGRITIPNLSPGTYGLTVATPSSAAITTIMIEG